MLLTKRSGLMMLLAIPLTLLGNVVGVPAAVADSFNGTVQAGPGLNVRSCVQCVDGEPSTALPVLDTLPNGTKVQIICYYNGQQIAGNWGDTTIWDRITSFELPDGTSGGFVGGGAAAVASDGFIFTNSNDPVAPHC